VKTKRVNFFLKHSVESWGYRTLSRFDSVPACDGQTVGRTDRQTDRRTDGFSMANTALCIASYADAL